MDRDALIALRSRWPVRAMILYCGLLLVGGLVPFDFTLPRPRAAAPIEWIPFTYVCAKHGVFCPYDRLANLALFVPLGALVALSRAGPSARRATIASGVVGLVLSLAIEAAQLALPSRFPSSADVLLNTLGALGGGAAMAWLVVAASRRVTRSAAARGAPRTRR
jgi:glycopeptide antibiotics resistance protein